MSSFDECGSTHKQLEQTGVEVDGKGVKEHLTSTIKDYKVVEFILVSALLSLLISSTTERCELVAGGMSWPGHLLAWVKAV